MSLELNSTQRLAVCRSSFGAKSLELAVAEWCIRVFGAVVIVGGVLGNVTTAYIQATERSNRFTTRCLMVSLALADCGVVLLAVVRYWLTETFDLDIRDLHPALCRLHQAVVATVSDLAVYTLCCIGVERFISVAFPYRVKQILSRRNFWLAYSLLLALLVGKNAPIGFFRFSEPCVRLLAPAPNVSGAGIDADALRRLPHQLLPHKCRYNREFSLWFAKLDLFTFLVVPYTMLLFCNVYIYAAMRRQAAAVKRHAAGGCRRQREAAGRRKPESVMKILAVLTVIHIITTLPASVGQLLKVYGYKFRTSPQMTRLMLNALKMLMFANNATNFVAYFISSTAFRTRVLAWCGRRHRPDPEETVGLVQQQQQQQQQQQKVQGSNLTADC